MANDSPCLVWVKVLLGGESVRDVLPHALTHQRTHAHTRALSAPRSVVGVVAAAEVLRPAFFCPPALVAIGATAEEDGNGFLKVFDMLG